jgi:hypothetical protein
MELKEAQLFRILTSFFGKDRVMFRMSVRSVCGGEVPKNIHFDGCNLLEWALATKCLFTIIDDEDNAKLVIDIHEGFKKTIDLITLENQKRLPMVLNASGVKYITISNEDIENIMDGHSDLDLVSWLRDQLC